MAGREVPVPKSDTIVGLSMFFVVGGIWALFPNTYIKYTKGLGNPLIDHSKASGLRKIGVLFILLGMYASFHVFFGHD
jgi:hypothetical protein